MVAFDWPWSLRKKVILLANTKVLLECVVTCYDISMPIKAHY